MSTLNRIPTYTEPLETGKATTRGWYTFWLGLLQGQPMGSPTGIVPGVSPYSYVAPLGGTVVLSGGTVTKVEVSRDGRRVYFTNSLYTPWDEQFYPEGVRSWMVKLDVDPAGAVSRDKASSY